MSHRSLHHPGVRPLAVLTAAVLALTGCGSAATDTADRASDDGEQLTGTVTVLAAASLTGAFTQIGQAFEAANPGVTVRFSFAGSSTLAAQITQGAPADVFASASPATMQTVVDAGDAAGPASVFVRNQLVIAVAAGNPLAIETLADLADPEVKVALCAAQVPCGAAAVTALAAGDVDLTPVTLEQDVKAALSKLSLGEVDAALVYRTDVAADDAVEAVEFAESAAAINDYPIVVLNDAPNPAAAEAFAAYVLSEPALDVLLQAGFQRP